MNSILEDDIKSFSLPKELTDKLRNSVIIVTGATGLIGSSFVRCIHHLDLGVRFILPVRDARKAALMFERLDDVSITQTDLSGYFNSADQECDFILHCASPTDGAFMCSHPAETFLLAIESTKEILEYARRHKVRGIVYVSSIEYYGQILDDYPVTEDMMGQVSHTAARSSYPLGKQAAEYLSVCYANEYDVPVKIARLTQTFGAGISPTDNRVFAQFAKNVIADKNIGLHTAGKSAKPYCYTTDAVSAIAYIMLKGTKGEAYNVATPGTYVSIRQLAETFRDNFNPAINVVVEAKSENNYAPDTRVNLNPSKLLQLGWQPQYDLRTMLSRLIAYLKESNQQ